ncbi:hypothetical protein ACHAQE_008064 [Botrytis cinerea]
MIFVHSIADRQLWTAWIIYMEAKCYRQGEKQAPNIILLEEPVATQYAQCAQNAQADLLRHSLPSTLVSHSNNPDVPSLSTPSLHSLDTNIYAGEETDLA